MSVRCTVHGFLRGSPPRKLAFAIGKDVSLVLKGSLGPRGLSEAARDLVEVGLAVHQIERMLPSSAGANWPERCDVTMTVRLADLWSHGAKDALAELLRIQSNTQWSWKFEPRRGRSEGVEIANTTTDPRAVERVVLFSGGLDSTSGLAAPSSASSGRTQLVSFYSKQLRLQQELAEALGFAPPTQARKVWSGAPLRGRSFFHRSFFFLCLAAAVASSYGITCIEQYENGILASAIPPLPALFMTRHAHPAVHRLAAMLFGEILGGRWSVRNPFLARTKRQCAKLLLRKPRAHEIIARTQTCWFLESNNVRGEPKRPGIACGICVPCLVRRTAVGDEPTAFTVSSRRIARSARLRRDFAAYSQFTERLRKQRHNLGAFYLSLPAIGRSIVDPPNGVLSRSKLHKLMVSFADEFAQTFPPKTLPPKTLPPKTLPK
jgi:hypothetical protein